MAQTLKAPKDIPGALDLSPDEQEVLRAQRKAVLDIMKEGRDLYLRNEMPSPPTENVVPPLFDIKRWVRRSL